MAPNYPAYRMAQALLGLKAACEKAQAATGGKAPNQDQVIAAFERPDVRGPGRQGRRWRSARATRRCRTPPTARPSTVSGKVDLDNIKRYPAECVKPPEGMKSRGVDQGGLPRRSK